MTETIKASDSDRAPLRQREAKLERHPGGRMLWRVFVRLGTSGEEEK